MPLSGEIPSAVRYLVPGAVASLAAFAFSRVMIEPLIGIAVDYEGQRELVESELTGEHGHGHELFARAVQENVGAAVGIVVFGIVMGVLFAVAHTVMRTALERRGFAPDPTGLALLLSAGMFVAIAFVPSLKYPANPPTVGLDETTGVRSSTFLTMTALSVVAACIAVAAGLALARQWGAWRASAFAAGGYAAVMLGVATVLPSFYEVPAPIAGPDGLLLDGFPAEVLADFRVYTTLNQALMWLMIGVVTAVLMAAWRRVEKESASFV
ncbi:CbtA family protein [Mycobacterium barrassiae]|uniref:CbtA family protein n=1 Tax=Mycobacterium barrassiae TaxID=319709 RepID=UPI002265B842|nr:CbtA family protein [Mycobacterium barrassiae]MCV7298250.1 CbtA family protein [Mycobacterium barrassiae]